MSRKIAIIDLGSNSARMTITEQNGKEITTLENCREYVRLSEGMGEHALLQEKPIRRTLKALKGFLDLIQRHGCEQTVAVATEAVRKAANQSIFLSRVKAELGLSIQVLDGEKESFYDYYASRSLLSPEENSLVLDVGGGSFELILANQNAFIAHSCMPLGAVVLTEQCEGNPDKMKAICLEQLRTLSWLPKSGVSSIIGLGGSIRAAAQALGAGKKVHGTVITAKALFSLYQSLLGMSVEQRMEQPGIGRDRCDIILAGLTPYLCLMERYGVERIVVSNFGIRDGILSSLLDNQKV